MISPLYSIYLQIDITIHFKMPPYTLGLHIQCPHEALTLGYNRLVHTGGFRLGNNGFILRKSCKIQVCNAKLCLFCVQDTAP